MGGVAIILTAILTSIQSTPIWQRSIHSLHQSSLWEHGTCAADPAVVSPFSYAYRYVVASLGEATPQYSMLGLGSLSAWVLSMTNWGTPLRPIVIRCGRGM